MITFCYTGGSGSHRITNAPSARPSIGELKIKFYCFVVVGDKEYILFEALRKGFVSSTGEPVVVDHGEDRVRTKKYQLNDSIGSAYLKVFTSINGFGLQNKYTSQYIKLDNKAMHSVQMTNFLSAGAHKLHPKYIFKGQGTRLNFNETQIFLANNSTALAFYNKQAILPRATCNEMIISTISSEVVKQQRIRRIRL